MNRARIHSKERHAWIGTMSGKEAFDDDHHLDETPSSPAADGNLQEKQQPQSKRLSEPSRVSALLGSLLHGHAQPAVPPEELAELLKCTNFTEREIAAFYKYSKPDSNGGISKTEFARICLDQGVHNVQLIERMFVVFDSDSSNGISHKELVKGLNPLLRGTREEVANLYFSLYELDNDGLLSAQEIISVYSDMVFVNEKDRQRGLTSQQKKEIVDWVDTQKQHSSNGKLDREAFVQAILEMEQKDRKPSLCNFRTVYYIFWTAWFEMGTSFALPAMGALSARIKDRFETDDTGIGALTAAYYFAAMVGPLVGGIFMDKYGPGWVVIGANVIVAGGAMCQAIADGPSQFWLLLLGRLLLGFGGEMTPFTTVEILGRLFPDYFGLMAGVRNLVQSVSGFLAFLLLPIWADAMSDFDGDNDGTSFALWMCFALGIVSLLACIVVKISMNKEDTAKAASSEEQSDQLTITKTMRAFAKATAPKAPVGCAKWKLPVSFYFACFGIKAQYFAPFGFTAFSNEIYRDKFGQTSTTASIQTGVISLVAGLMGPPMGALSDKYGRRAMSLVVACLLSMVGFVVLAIATGGSVAVWVASILFALQYGFGDTVAYISIRFIVGVERAGVGYGVYGIVGNFVSGVVPVIGGIILDQYGGEELVCWYFGGLMLAGAFCWLAVRLLEGTRSLLELPADKIIETSDKDLHLAALSYVIAPPDKLKKEE